MNHEYKTLPLEVKELDEAGTFTGLLSVYGVIDEYGDVVEHGAYTKTIQESGGKLPMLWQHSQDMPIGTLDVTDTPEGLLVKGKLLLNDDVPMAKTAYALLKAGVVRGLSIGFRTLRKKVDGKIRRLKEIKLYEGSLVTIPANPLALVTAVKSFEVETKDFDSELQRIQVMDGLYQMMCALRYAVYSVLYSQKLSAEEKVDASGLVVDQFRAAFMDFLPKYLAADEGGMDLMSAADAVERLKAAPDPIRDEIEQFSRKFLGIEHPGTTEPVAASAAEEPEEKAMDLEALRSLLSGAESTLRTALAAPTA